MVQYKMEEDIQNLLFNNKCFAFGSYVYKKILRGEEINDYDFACKNVASCVGQLVYAFNCKAVALNANPQIVSLKCGTIKIEIMEDNFVMHMLDRTNCGPFRLIMMKNNEFGCIKSGFDGTPVVSTDEKLVKESIHKIKHSILNEDANLLRDKDKEYFTNWTKIKKE